MFIYIFYTKHVHCQGLFTFFIKYSFSGILGKPLKKKRRLWVRTPAITFFHAYSRYELRKSFICLDGCLALILAQQPRQRWSVRDAVICSRTVNQATIGEGMQRSADHPRVVPI